VEKSAEAVAAEPSSHQHLFRRSVRVLRQTVAFRRCNASFLAESSMPEWVDLGDIVADRIRELTALPGSAMGWPAKKKKKTTTLFIFVSKFVHAE